MGDESYNKGYSAIPLQNYKHATFTLQTTYDPIFVIFGCIKTQLFLQKPWTYAIFLHRCFTIFFQTYSKYGKMHHKGWNCYTPERNDWRELALLAANGRKSLESKIRKVKLSATSMTTYDLIFVIIGCFRTQLVPPKLWTCAIFLREYYNRLFTTFFQTYSK